MLAGFSLIRDEIVAVPLMVKVLVNRVTLLASTTLPWELPLLWGENTIWRDVR